MIIAGTDWSRREFVFPGLRVVRVGVQSNVGNWRAIFSLFKFAELTGGAAFVLRKNDDFRSFFFVEAHLDLFPVTLM